MFRDHLRSIIFHIRPHRQPRKHRNLHNIRPNHHVRQPDGEGADVPEIEVRSSVQDTCLQADRRGGQDTVDPDGELLGQRHVNDDWQDAEQERS